LFDPKLPITVAANADPCDPNNVAAGTANREANCIAALQANGLPLSSIVDADGNYAWTNPLTARFAGVSGGNPALDVETADTVTLGFVYRPELIEGLSITVDYWDVEITDAISAVDSGDILEGCFDSASYPNLGFCNAFTRRADGGLNFLETGQINFAKLEARGLDFAASYSISVGENDFGVRLQGSRQERLDRFFNPLDQSDVDPEIMELQRPRLFGSLGLSWNRGPIRVGLQTIYQGKQAVAEVEEVRGIAGLDPLYGSAGFFHRVLISDLNARYQWNDGLSVFGGINNLWDEEPFSTQTAWPVGPRGRTFFLGLSYSL
jgi:outer membrane receptor protein involved in Fe transport